MIKAIHAIMTNRKHHIYGEAVTRVFSLLINLHSGNYQKLYYFSF